MKRENLTARVVAAPRDQSMHKYEQSNAFVLLYTPKGEKITVVVKLDKEQYDKIRYAP